MPISPTTKKEDERLKKELQKADIGKFKRVMKFAFKPAKKIKSKT